MIKHKTISSILVSLILILTFSQLNLLPNPLFLNIQTVHCATQDTVIGYDEIGDTADATTTQNSKDGTQYTVNYDNWNSSIGGAYIKANTGTIPVSFVIYNDTGANAPDKLIANSSVLTVEASYAWYNFTWNNINGSNGDKIWIGVNNGGSTTMFYYWDSGESKSREFNSDTPPPDISFGASTSSTRKKSIYINITYESGGDEFDADDITFDISNGRGANLTKIGTDHFGFDLGRGLGLHDYGYWFGLKILQNCSGHNVTFTISNVSISGGFSMFGYANVHPVYSYDEGVTWALVDGAVRHANYSFSFWHNCTQDSVIFMCNYIIQWDKLEPYLNTTVDSYDFANVTVIGYSEEDERPLYLARVTNPEIPDENKTKIWVVGGHHTGESAGVMLWYYMLQYVCYNATLRDSYVWYFVFVNPDGAYLGYTRCNGAFINLNLDYNGTYNEAEVTAHKANFTEIQNSEGIDLMIDLHSDTDAQRYIRMVEEGGTNYTMQRAFVDYLVANVSFWETSKETNPNVAICRGWSLDVRHVALSFAFESREAYPVAPATTRQGANDTVDQIVRYFNTTVEYEGEEEPPEEAGGKYSFYSGLEWGNLNELYDHNATSPATYNISSVESRGSYSILVNTSVGGASGRARFYADNPPDLPSLYAEADFYINSWSSYMQVLRFAGHTVYNTTSFYVYISRVRITPTHIYLRLGHDHDEGNVSWFVDGGSSELELNYSTSINVDTWYNIRMYYSKNVSGVARVWLNDVLVIDWNGNSSSSPDIDVCVGGCVLLQVGANANFYFDEFSAWNSTHPRSKNPLVSSRRAGETSTLSSDWIDTEGMSGYIPSCNNTGVWVNGSYVSAGFSGNDTATYTITVNSTNGLKIGYRFYANDTLGNWGILEDQIFIVNTPTIDIVYPLPMGVITLLCVLALVAVNGNALYKFWNKEKLNLEGLVTIGLINLICIALIVEIEVLINAL